MVDLHERLTEATAAFTDDVALDDPSRSTSTAESVAAGAPAMEGWTETADLDRRRRRRLGVLTSTLVAAAAGVLAVVMFSSGGGGTVTVGGSPEGGGASPAPPPGATGAEPAAPAPSGPADLSAMSPEEALSSMVDASLASRNWVRSSTVETAEGEDFGLQPGVHASNRKVVFNAPGLVEVSTQLNDGSRVTNEYADFDSGLQYWLSGPDQWKSAAFPPESVTDPRVDLMGLLSSEGCVMRVDPSSVLIVAQPSGPCPAEIPPEDQWSTLGSGRHLVTADPEGRVGSATGFTDEAGVPSLGGMKMVDRYADYGAAPTVSLPDPSDVEFVAGDFFREITMYGENGYITKSDPGTCPSGATECQPGG